MHVWNLLHVAHWKCRTQKISKKSRAGHHRTTLSGYIFATNARIDNQKKTCYTVMSPQMSSQYGEHWPTCGSDLLASLGHPCNFQRVSGLGSVTARHLSSGHEPNFAELSTGCHLYSAGWPSRWALAHILVVIVVMIVTLVLFVDDCCCVCA